MHHVTSFLIEEYVGCFGKRGKGQSVLFRKKEVTCKSNQSRYRHTGTAEPLLSQPLDCDRIHSVDGHKNRKLERSVTSIFKGKSWSLGSIKRWVVDSIPLLCWASSKFPKASMQCVQHQTCTKLCRHIAVIPNERLCHQP